MAKPQNRRQEASEQRRQAILDAGLEVFSEHGFEAARLDDLAERAGVAKGTIYLFFKSKEDLFEQIILSAARPVLAQAAAIGAAADLPFAQMLHGMFALFEREILGTSRRKIARVVIAEGARFPSIAEFYHREIIAKMLGLIQMAARRAHERGELTSDAIERFPHLVSAPMVLSIVWDGLFSTIAPLDVRGLLAAHLELLTGVPPQTLPRSPA